METRNKSFWWLISSVNSVADTNENNSSAPQLELQSSSSINNLSNDKNSNFNLDVDVGSIIEEINRVAAQSPLGPYEKSVGERSIDDLLKEAEKIYIESSKSFEQLSQRSKTSQNISDLLSNISKDSTPTPKSLSPLPMDPDPQEPEVQEMSQSDDDYSEDFSEESKMHSAKGSPTNNSICNESKELNCIDKKNIEGAIEKSAIDQDIDSELSTGKSSSMIKSQSLNYFKASNTSRVKTIVKSQSEVASLGKNVQAPIVETKREHFSELDEKLQKYVEDDARKQCLIEDLERHNKLLKKELEDFKVELQRTQTALEQTKSVLSSKTLSSPEINMELEKALEDLKDSKEMNTSLQLQLETVNKSHQLLKSSYDDLLDSNKKFERRLFELDNSLDKYKNEFILLRQSKDKLVENEVNLNKLLEMEKLQNKNFKLQHEKDAKCIQDLNRQIKEMERIIARKHPDSVSALIVAAKENAMDSNLTARKILEDRIKSLEQEQVSRETQSSKVFMEIQEKFNQMKSKYENHIEDLELHVCDLKNQLKRRSETYDVYTQTMVEDKIPQKETFTTFTQTDAVTSAVPSPPTTTSKPQRSITSKKNEDSHLLATIRGLQADLANKEKVITKLQKEIEDLKKTNKRLQKEREGSLKNLIDKKELKSLPLDRLQTRSNSCSSEKDFRKEETVLHLKRERDKLKLQLDKLQEDYQQLQSKRIGDLTALQEAHEQEVSNYIASVSPLREQLEIHQISLASLQSQLTSAREELAIVRVESDHLNNRLLNMPTSNRTFAEDTVGVSPLLQKIGFLEKQYVEREYRLRSMIQNLAQKNLTNRSCPQCSERHQQLISYKAELDQTLTSVRAFQ
ncbi:centrosomal protein of 162 kDa [Diorhabda carinulata]|uniref:centrosomal protein of 162 kDa n=1 Tax=Diorhabda carinulata TaxID=1163345 RepID=UPI0025A30D80|nr:centrosomal protein of 162 kDa [Diorhabda carinulata]